MQRWQVRCCQALDTTLLNVIPWTRQCGLVIYSLSAEGQCAQVRLRRCSTNSSSAIDDDAEQTCMLQIAVQLAPLM